MKSCHNKTSWANFVLMQDSWLQLKSDSISWRNTLKNSHNSQIHWLVVSTPCQETKIHLNQKVGPEGIPKSGPYWKLQHVVYKVNMEWKSELSLWTKTILTRGSEFLMAWLNWSRTWTTRSRTTTSRKPQRCSSKTMRWNRMHVLLRADQRLKQNHKDVFLPAHPQELYLLGEEFGLILIHKNIRSPIFQCRRNWSIFFVMEVYFETMMERLKSGEQKIIFRKILCFVIIGLTKWKSAMAGGGRRTQDKISVLCWFIRNNSVPPSSPRSFRTQSYWSFITEQCRDSGRFLPVHVSCRMCNQFTCHHQFRINTGRTNFEQQTDSCGSYGQRTKGSWHDRLGSTASCTIHAQSMEETSKHCVLGRPQLCSEERINVLSDSIERGNWRSHVRESIHVTSASTTDLLETRLEKRV